MPCLLYALEACPINTTQEKSLEFTINRVLMKIFRTVSLSVFSIDVIRECRLWFGMPDIKVLVVKRKKKFLMKYAITSQTDSVNCLALVLCQSIVFYLFYLLLVFLLPYRIYGEIKLCIAASVHQWRRRLSGCVKDGDGHFEHCF